MNKKKKLVLFIPILFLAILSILYVGEIKYFSKKYKFKLEKKVDINMLKCIEESNIASAVIEEVSNSNSIDENVDCNSNKDTEIDKKNKNVTKSNVVINKKNDSKNTTDERKIEKDFSNDNSKESEKTQEILPDKPKEEYKFNPEITNKIINIINNNLTNDMVKYVYNIAVDETIVNLTNQFTYTEKRVIDKINLKFGVIRVYARDYYKNGSYMWTESFLI